MRDAIEDVVYEMYGVVSVLDMLIEDSEDKHQMYLFQLLRNSIDRSCTKLSTIEK